ncbi:stage II sporulation protein P [Clostridium felsineum]|uniref:stage II sporulation protein P n=1 Tax=Clostridium felsineum TaxID=36839 RepID=UPI00098CA6DB|nr:stage II sporulation protein P [Clostridium felsineum]URZ04679.1 hypothetical protein CLAUR_047680 [Clostridium felsineum]
MKRKHRNLLVKVTTVIFITGVLSLSLGCKNESLAATYKNKSEKQTAPTIVIYNSQAYESYKSGKKVTDIGNLLSERIDKEGMKSIFINNTITTKDNFKTFRDYENSYNIARTLVTQRVKDYNKCILLDITCNKVPDKKTVITLAKTNPHYKENKKFADSLVAQFNKLKKPATISDWCRINNYFNQDLSNKSIILELGDVQSTDNELNSLINTTASALKNLNNK